MKKINRKIIAILLLSFCFAVTLFGCGKNDKVTSISVVEESVLEASSSSPYDYHLIKIEVVYGKGEKKEVIKLEDNMLSTEMLEKITTEGVQTITVTYEGAATTFTMSVPSVIIVPEKNIVSIEVVEESITNALALEIFDYHQIKILVKYDDNSQEEKNLEAEMLTEEMLKKFISKGEQKITVNYQGFETSFKIKMPTAVVRFISVNEESLTKALSKENFNYADIKIDLHYSNGKIVSEKVSGDMFSLTDLALLYCAGEHEITVNYHSLLTTFKVNNEKDLDIDISKLDEVENGMYVAIKGYVTTYSTNQIYLHGENSGTYVKTNYGITSKASLAEELADNYEIIVVGKKTEDNGFAILEDVSNLVKTGKESLGKASDVTNTEDISKALYSYVNVKGATLDVRPGYLAISSDSELVISLGGKKVHLICQSDVDKTYKEKLYVKWSELLKGHELVIDKVIAAKYNGEDALLITKDSFFDYKKVEHVYVKDETVDNPEFAKYLQELFIEELGTNPIDINYLIYDVKAFDEKYGTDLSNAKLEPSNPDDYDPSTSKEYYDSILEAIDELKTFDRDKLSAKQKIAYDVILDKLNGNLKFHIMDENDQDQLFYYGTQLGSYLGYQAQLPNIIAEYRFDDKKDIENYLDCLRYTLDDFKALYAYEKAKMGVENSQQLTDKVIDKVIEQCDKFIETGENNYLISVFDNRIGTYDFLTEEEVENYKKLNKEAVVEYFIPAYVWLKENLLELKELNDDSRNGSLSFCQYGKEYYEALFQQSCGTSMTVPELLEYIEEKISLADSVTGKLTSYNGNYMVDSGAIVYLNNTSNVDYYSSLNNVIPFIQASSLTDFPTLKNEYLVGKQIMIKAIAPELQENSSPAFYLTTPFDANVGEVIYYNPPEFSEVANYMYQTLSHEGWPGHLYQNVYAKEAGLEEIRYLLSYKGYSEGWATYVENYVVKYALPNSYSAQQIALLDPASSLFSCKLDLGINYLGWTVEDVIKEYGLTVKDVEDEKYTFTNGEKVTMEYFENLYYTFVEIPTNYLMYFFSACQILDIKEEFKDEMGLYYSDLLFHTIYLETGEVSFDILRNVYHEYALKHGVTSID